jgi:hypothetical protein
MFTRTWIPKFTYLLETLQYANQRSLELAYNDYPTEYRKKLYFDEVALPSSRDD